MKECQLKPFEVRHFEVKHLETLKRATTKKEKKLFQGSLQITEEVTEKFYNNCSERFKEIPLKTSVVVYFTLILPKKSTPAWTAASEIIWESRPDGFLLCRCCRSKMLKQLFRKVCGGALFLILASFQVIFSNISKQLF